MPRNKTKPFKLVFEHAKDTQRKKMFRQAVPWHEDLMHEAEIPYLYVDKTFWREHLGSALVIEVNIWGRLPDGEYDYA